MSKYDDTPGLTNPLGTYTYTAPAEPAPTNPEDYEHSLGQTGTAFWSGMLSDEEYNNTLTPRQWRGYGGNHGIADKMRRSDSVIAAGERAIKLPILSSTWEVQPAEQGDPERNRAVAKFIEAALFEHNRDSWRGWLEQALDYLVFGFMLFERVYKVIDDPRSEWFGFVTLDHLAPRMPWTVDAWIIDNTRGERLSGVAQVDYAGVPSGWPIPAWKLVRLTYQQAGSNFEGRAALRASYRPWYIRGKAWKLWAVGLERWAVPTPVAMIRESSYAAFKTQVSKALQSLRTNDKGRIVMPDSVKLDSYSPKSNLDPSVFLKETAYEIVMSTLTNFLMTGRETGTQSLGREQASFLSQSLTAITDQIAEVLTDGTDGYPGVIKQLVDLNFANVESYPKLVCSSVGQRDVVEMIDAMNKAAAAGIISPTRDDEDHIRERLKLPSTAEEETEVDVTLRPEQVLNGAQIMGAKAIINDAFAGAIPHSAALAMLVSLVNVDPEQAAAMLSGTPPNPAAASEAAGPAFEASRLPGVTLPLPNEHAARQEPPWAFKSFRRIHPEGIPEGVDFILGVKEGGGSTVQSVRFKSNAWTVEEAKDWLTENGFTSKGIEAAEAPEQLEKKTNFVRVAEALDQHRTTSGPGLLESRPYSRPLTDYERFISLEEIEQSQDRIGRQVGARLELAQEDFITEFVEAAGPLIEAGDVEGVMSLSVKGADKLAEQLTGPLEKAFARGYASIAHEFVRQLKGLPVDASQDRPVNFQVEDDDLTKKDKELKLFPGAYLTGVAEVDVTYGEIPDSEEIDANKLIKGAALQASQYTADRVQSSGRNVAALQAQSGVFDVAALTASFDNLSVAMLNNRAVASSILSFSSGRAVGGEVAENQEIVRKAFYSAILDRDTCEPCAEVDTAFGENTDGLGASGIRQFRPPLSRCEGRDRCRCMIVYIFDEERVR